MRWTSWEDSPDSDWDLPLGRSSSTSYHLSSLMDWIAIIAYYSLLLLLSAHGLHRALLVVRLLRGEKQDPAQAPSEDLEDQDLGDRNLADSKLPAVTVQLPIYNELYVVDSLLEAAAALDWPRDRLEIQVLDDSTDETLVALHRKVQELQERGVDIRQICRPDRKGFKAGALAFGLHGDESCEAARGEYVAVFDADFLPTKDFLQRTIPPLMADPGLALVQARWDHLNRDHSLLTRVQALFLDAHFAVEHEARQRAGHFLNFNGTAGVWRLSAIAEAGGWSHDTLTEDLDLSFRAQMKGLRFRYLHDLGVPSELPVEMNAFKGQQHRWAKGAIETSLKLLPSLWRNRNLSLSTRLEGTFHLTCNLAYPVMGLVTVLALPMALALAQRGDEIPAWLDRYLLGFGILPILVYFLVGQLRVGQGFWKSLLLLPFSIALGAGLCVNNTRAVLEALLGHKSAFVRTPKYRVGSEKESWLGKKYLARGGLWPVLELSLGVSCAFAAVLCLQTGFYGLAFLDSLFALGYLQVGLASLMPRTCERLRFGWAPLGETTS